MATKILYAIADTQGNQGSETLTAGSDPELTTQIYAPVYNCRPFFKFNISLPDAKSITSAVMYLYHTYSSGETTSPTTYRCATDWVEATLCWKNMPTTTGENLGGWSFTSTINDWHTLDITTTFTNWWNLSVANYGICLVEGGTDQASSKIASKEYADSSKQPYLLITYVAKPKGGLGIGSPMIFIRDALEKGKEYFKNKKGLWLPDNRILKPELVF